MPNWCTCEVEITGNENEIKQLLEKGKIPNKWSDESNFSIENFIPTPINIIDSNDWHIENWGTKWDISPEIDNQGTFIQMKFDSAWSPPTEAFDRISKIYPLLEFKFSFSEPGMDFCGVAKYKNGLQNIQEYSYNERFGFDLFLDYEQIEAKNEKITIPLSLERYLDPFDFESQKIKSLCTLTIPMNIEEDEVQKELNSSITITSNDPIGEELDKHEYTIVEFLINNLDKLKKAAAYKQLDTSLPVNETSNLKQRKI
jgi:hypothetical protein